MEVFIPGIPLLEPRIYRLGEIRLPPVLFYSDAEWTVLDQPPWLSKCVGGIMWESRQKPFAAAVDTPQHLVDGLSPRKTQIIPLELMAAAGMLYTYQDRLRGQVVIFSSTTKASAVPRQRAAAGQETSKLLLLRGTQCAWCCAAEFGSNGYLPTAIPQTNFPDMVPHILSKIGTRLTR